MHIHNYIKVIFQINKEYFMQFSNSYQDEYITYKYEKYRFMSLITVNFNS